MFGLGLSLTDIPVLMSRVGAAFAAKSSGGTAYPVSRTVLSSGGTPYVVPQAVLSSGGTPYNVI